MQGQAVQKQFHTHSEDDDEGPPLSGPLSKNLTGQMHDWTLDLARISLELVKKERFFFREHCGISSTQLGRAIVEIDKKVARGEYWTLPDK